MVCYGFEDVEGMWMASRSWKSKQILPLSLPKEDSPDDTLISGLLNYRTVR